jgi:acyl carrier protein
MASSLDGTVVDRVRGCMRTVLALSDKAAAAITLETTPLALPQWTSLTHLELILEIERRFDVMFAADDIATLASVGALVETIERLTH